MTTPSGFRATVIGLIFKTNLTKSELLTVWCPCGGLFYSDGFQLLFGDAETLEKRIGGPRRYKAELVNITPRTIVDDANL